MATLSNIDEMKRVAREYPPLTPQQQFGQQRAPRKRSNAGSPVEAAATVDPAQEQTQPTQTNQGIILSQATPGQTMESPGVYQPQPYEASQNELVSAQVSRLLGENSKYLQQNRTQAQQAAHARGLSNSAMAAGWGQEAAIKSALPIAQQDAGYFQSRGLEDQKGIISSHLQQQQGAIESALQNQGTQDTAYLYGEQAGYESQLQQQAADQQRILQQQAADQQRILQQQIDHAKSVLQSEGATQQQKLQAQIDLAEAERQKTDIAAQIALLQTDIDAQLKQQQNTIAANKALQAQQDAAHMERMQVEIAAQTELQDAQNEWESYRQQIDIEAQAHLAGLEFSRETQMQLTDSLGTMSQQFQQEMATILTNKDFKTAQSRNLALAAAAQAYKDNVDLITSLAGVAIEWPEDFGAIGQYAMENVDRKSGFLGGLNRAVESIMTANDDPTNGNGNGG